MTIKVTFQGDPQVREVLKRKLRKFLEKENLHMQRPEYENQVEFFNVDENLETE